MGLFGKNFSNLEQMKRQLMLNPAEIGDLVGKQPAVEIDKSGRKVVKKLPKDDVIQQVMIDGLILGDGISLSPYSNWSHCNLNTIAIGSNAEVESSHVIPNVLSANTSFVVEDQDGSVYKATEEVLRNKGYDIRVFCPADPAKSQAYNPYRYIDNEDGVTELSKWALSILEKDHQTENDNLRDAYSALFNAVFGYVYEAKRFNERTMHEAIKYLCFPTSIKAENAEERLSLMFDELEKEYPSSFAVSEYRKFKSLVSGKTIYNSLVTVSLIFGIMLDNEDFKRVTREDMLDLDALPEGKTSLFIIVPADREGYKNGFGNYLMRLLYTQIDNICQKRFTDPAAKPNPIPGKVKLFVRPAFPPVEVGEWYPAQRKYGCSTTMMTTGMQELQSGYNGGAAPVIESSDSVVVFSVADGDNTTKATLRKMGVTEDNFAAIAEDDKEILCVRGYAPVVIPCYDIHKHPNFKAEDEEAVQDIVADPEAPVKKTVSEEKAREAYERYSEIRSESAYDRLLQRQGIDRGKIDALSEEYHESDDQKVVRGHVVRPEEKKPNSERIVKSAIAQAYDMMEKERESEFIKPAADYDAIVEEHKVTPVSSPASASLDALLESVNKKHSEAESSPIAPATEEITVPIEDNPGAPVESLKPEEPKENGGQVIDESWKEEMLKQMAVEEEKGTDQAEESAIFEGKIETEEAPVVIPEDRRNVIQIKYLELQHKYAKMERILVSSIEDLLYEHNLLKVDLLEKVVEDIRNARCDANGDPQPISRRPIALPDRINGPWVTEEDMREMIDGSV